ncbi:MAG: hypothetical protein HW391_30 [Chloroflexi bacterium]|nr:hypothetical protein [Chloroflexota bacterium]
MTSSSRRTPPPTNRTRSSRLLRTAPERPFLERHRSKLLWGLAGAALIGVVAMAFLNATSPAYACSTEWEPAPTSAPGPDATPRLGYVQDDFGQAHVTIGSFVKYVLCPPASGKHYNAQSEGPVRPGVYGPDDQATPMGWIHNLEHGGVVVLYRCADGDTGCSDEAQQANRDLFASFPNSPICNMPGASTLVVARFDQMAWPYAALVWGQVLPLESFDAQRIRDFYAQQGELTNPEPFCPKPTPTPAPA